MSGCSLHLLYALDMYYGGIINTRGKPGIKEILASCIRHPATVSVRPWMYSNDRVIFCLALEGKWYSVDGLGLDFAAGSGEPGSHFI
jgi:hypothetical protein